MFSKFNKLKKEKRERIINSSLKEFAENGYDKASTNNIVKRAGISKGLLFHYFKNKKGLFSFLFQYSTDIFKTDLFNKIDFNERDIIERIYQLMVIKMELFNQFPDLFNFFKVAYLDDSKEVEEIIKKNKKAVVNNDFNRFFAGIDYSYFKDGLDIERVIKIIIWTFEKWGEEYINMIKYSKKKEVDFDKINKDFSKYIELFRGCFYK